MWLGIPQGTVISAFATGAVARAQGPSGGVPGNSASPWTLLQLSPLPQMDRASFLNIPGGVPIQLVILTGTVGPPPASSPNSSEIGAKT